MMKFTISNIGFFGLVAVPNVSALQMKMHGGDAAPQQPFIRAHHHPVGVPLTETSGPSGMHAWEEVVMKYYGASSAITADGSGDALGAGCLGEGAQPCTRTIVFF